MHRAGRRGRPPIVSGALLVLVGLVLAAGGGWLMALGGSWFYLASGLLTALAGWLLIRGERWGAYLYGLAWAATLVWSLYEVGFDPWSLAPRLIVPTLFGLWLLMPWVKRSLRGGPDFHRRDSEPRPEPSAGAAPVVLVLALALVAAGLAFGPQLMAEVFPPAAPPPTSAAPAQGDWPGSGNGLDASRYAAFGQISRANVAGLKLAWSFAAGQGSTAALAPIKVGAGLYLCAAHDRVVALDAETGRQLWAFDPSTAARAGACRGVSYFKAEAAVGPCADRIVGATSDARLFALDAQTGQLCPGFGQGGYVSLLDGMGPPAPGLVFRAAPPTVVNGHIVLGAEGADGAPSGVIRAFDAVTGQLQWAWDLGRPDRKGAPEPGGRYTPGVPAAAAAFAADPQLNLVYVPTGNAAPAFFGGKRRAFDDAYSSAVVAIDLTSGWARWSFQTTRHDLWGYDLTAQPVLAELPGPEGAVPVLIQATRRGDVFVLDRRDGRPIVPVREHAVGQDGVDGERPSASQPVSALSLAPPALTEADMWGLTPFDQLWCRIRFQGARHDGAFTPPGVTPAITVGARGVLGWGGVSVDPAAGVLYANTSAVPGRDRLSPDGRGGFVLHAEPFLGPFQLPCVRPPWGRLSAVDLKTRKTLWSRPTGTAEETGPLGHASRLPWLVGTPNEGGVLATGGGLVFSGATQDPYLRAYDRRTGAQLWQARLPAAGQATPISYVGPASGRQFVVIAAGGRIQAYALPRR